METKTKVKKEVSDFLQSNPEFQKKILLGTSKDGEDMLYIYLPIEEFVELYKKVK